MTTDNFTNWPYAVIAPWAFAPHPNFSHTPGTTASVLAGFILGSRQDPRETPAKLDVPQWAVTALNAIEGSLSSSTQSKSLETLWEIANTADLPLDVRSACAVIAAAGEADRDRSADSLEPLQGLLNELIVAKKHFASALISQQLALRFADEGADQQSREAFEASAAHVERMVTPPADLGPFSPAYIGTVGDLFASVRYHLTSNIAEGISATERLSGDTWVEVVTRQKGWIAAKLASEISHARDLGVRELYKDKFEATVNRTVFGGSTPSLAGYPALLAAELSGSVYAARHARRTVAEHLMLSDVATDAHFSAEALKLLRRASVSAEVRAAARWIRKRGPLRGLSLDGHNIATRPDLHKSLTSNDLFVLEMAADLLNPDDVARAQRGAWDRLDDLLSTGALDWSFADRALSTIGTLEQWVRPGSASPERIAKVVKSLIPLGQTIDRSFAKLIGAVDWAEAKPEAKIALTETLDGLTIAVRSELPQTISATAARLLSGTSTASSGLDQVAAVIAQGAGHPHDVSATLAPLRSALLRVRDDAAQGVASFGGYDEVALAVSYGNAFNSSTLSAVIADVLLDEAVLKSKKSRALDLLGAQSEALDSLDRSRLKTEWDRLASSKEDWRAKPDAVWPELVRAGWTFGTVSVEDLFESTILLESGGPSDRVQAARTAGHALRHSKMAPAWLSYSLLHLSTDTDPDVVAEAARALPEVFRSSDLLRLPSLRLTSLLRSDSVTVPLFALAGIESVSRDGVSLDPSLRSAVTNLESSHPSRLVRDKAAVVKALLVANEEA